MRQVKLFLILILITSCTLTKDFEFYFKRNNSEYHATGTTASPFINGDTLLIKVANAPRRKCVAILIDGNNHIKKNCKGKKGSFTVFDLGKITPRTLKSVGLSVVRKGYDTMSGKLYLGLANAKYEAVGLAFDCPYQSGIGNQFTCMRPKDFKFIFTIYAPRDGTVQVTGADCAGQNFKDTFAVSEGEEINYTITNTVEGYCPIRIDFKNDELKQSSTLHVDFYKI